MYISIYLLHVRLCNNNCAGCIIYCYRKIIIFQIEIVNATSETTIPLANYMDVNFEIGDAVILVYKNNTK